MQCDCSCVLDCSDGFSQEKLVKARKQHRCCECGDIIKKGEEYQVASGCWDGSWDRFKTCAFCVKLRNTYCPGGYIYGELAETLEACFGFWYPADPSTYQNAEREPEPWQLRELAEEKAQMRLDSPGKE